MHAQEALKFVQAKRPIVNPNDGFWAQIEEYSLMLNKKPSDELTMLEQANQQNKQSELVEKPLSFVTLQRAWNTNQQQQQ